MSRIELLRFGSISFSIDYRYNENTSITIMKLGLMGLKRRTFIGGSIAGLIAGCTESEGAGDSPDSGVGGGSVSTPEPEEMLDRTVRVSEDDYRGWTFSLNYDVRMVVDFTVRSGPEVDIFVMEDDEYSQLRNGNRFHAKSFGGVSGRQTVRLSSSKEWAFVVDNSSAGSRNPPTNFDDDVAEVEVEAILHYNE